MMITFLHFTQPLVAYHIECDRSHGLCQYKITTLNLKHFNKKGVNRKSESKNHATTHKAKH